MKTKLLPPARGLGAIRKPPLSGKLQEKRFTRQVALFLAAHVVLAGAMQASSLVSTGHALATLAAGAYWIVKSRTPDRLIPVFGYVIGAEVVWRGTGARIPWEFGKYAIILFSVAAIVRFRLFQRISRLPFFYVFLLLPSLLVLPYFDRREIAFNLSGPIALAVATAFFSSQKLNEDTFKKLLIGIIAPILGLAAIASFSTLTAVDVEFNGSTRVTSAGIGPNQVSAVLGLGALIAFIYTLIDRRHRLLQYGFLGAGLWFSAQSALTFSRGGLATFIGALAAGSFFLLQDRNSRGALVLRGSLAILIAAFVIIPALNTFTGGAIEKRFTNASLTGRDKIIQGDLIAFRENPALGVGPGQSKTYHEITFSRASTHTEYSRILAEHGSLGLLALVLLVMMSAYRLRISASALTRAWAASTTVWSLLYMFHSAMRLAAPALTFALGASILLLDTPRPKQVLSPLRRRRRISAKTRLGPRLQPNPARSLVDSPAPPPMSTSASATSTSSTASAKPPSIGGWAGTPRSQR